MGYIDCMDWHDSLASLSFSNLANFSNFCNTASKLSWLEHPGSMTAFLKNKQLQQPLELELELELKLLKAGWCLATSEEAIRLGVAEGDKIFERIIVESSGDTVLIYARSYYSQFCVEYFGDDLLALGDGFLGELITNKYPHLYKGRSKFEFAKLALQDLRKTCVALNRNDRLFAQCENTDSELVARRSLFKLENKIYFNLEEIFFPVLINKLSHEISE